VVIGEEDIAKVDRVTKVINLMQFTPDQIDPM
jgi:hypothetical protein